MGTFFMLYKGTNKQLFIVVQMVLGVGWLYKGTNKQLAKHNLFGSLNSKN